MSVLIDKNTRLLVQGITGTAGAFHTRQCIDYGTNSGDGYDAGESADAWEKVAIDRAKLPGNHHAGCMQDRDHARLHSQARKCGSHLALGNAHIRGGVATDVAKMWTVDVHRN